jgi:hypothetical protein
LKARLTHEALKSTTRQSNVSSAASETLFALARLKRILKSSDAIRRGNGEKMLHPAKQERNPRRKRSLSALQPILNTSRRLNCRNLGSSKTKKPKNQMNTTKTLIAGAAVAGLMAGSLPVRAYAASAPTQAGVSLQTLAEGEKGTHSCKGQNACKGQGGCKTSDAGCKGKNSCKGKGGCATDGSKPQ